MRGLAISKHIGIRDIQHCMGQIGHQLDIRSYSFHSHIFGYHQHPVDYDAGRLLDIDYCRRWYAAHPDLHGYDFYVSFYEPMSILLFAASEKPLIMVCPIRSFFPFEQRAESAKDALRQLSHLTVVANSKYDQAYFSALCPEIPCRYIPSLCGYLGLEWSGAGQATRNDWILDWRSCPRFEMDGTVPRRELQNYSYSELYSYRGYIEVDPRQINTMSFFERYAAGMPMMYPSAELLRSMKGALSELHFSTVSGGNPDIDIGLADYYQWPNIILFDSITDLIEKTYLIDWSAAIDIHKKMIGHHQTVIAGVLGAWKSVVSGVGCAVPAAVAGIVEAA